MHLPSKAGMKVYIFGQVYIHTDPGATLSYFMARSNLVLQVLNTKKQRKEHLSVAIVLLTWKSVQIQILRDSRDQDYLVTLIKRHFTVVCQKFQTTESLNLVGWLV